MIKHCKYIECLMFFIKSLTKNNKKDKGFAIFLTELPVKKPIMLNSKYLEPVSEDFL